MKKLLLLTLLTTASTQCFAAQTAGQEIAEQKALLVKKNDLNAIEMDAKPHIKTVVNKMPRLSALVQKAAEVLDLEGLVDANSFAITTRSSDAIWVRSRKKEKPVLVINSGAAAHSDAILTAVIGRALAHFGLEKKHSKRKFLAECMAYLGVSGLGITAFIGAHRRGLVPQALVRTRPRAKLTGLGTGLAIGGIGLGIVELIARLYSRKIESKADEVAFTHWPDEMGEYLEYQQQRSERLVSRLEHVLEEKPSKELSGVLKKFKKNDPRHKSKSGLMDYEPTHDERLDHLLDYTGQL